jgi:hypothetical protein
VRTSQSQHVTSWAPTYSSVVIDQAWVIVRQEICDCEKRTVVQIRVISAWLTDYSNINVRVTCHFIRVLIGLRNWGYLSMYGIEK